MFCNENFKESLDYLFIDEAGQYALIETVVVSHAAKNIIYWRSSTIEAADKRCSP